MDRRGFARAAAMLGLSNALPARGQLKKPARIGYLSLATLEADRSWIGAFKDGLRQLGYVEGRDIEIEYRHAAGDAGKMPALAAELIRLRSDVLVVYGAWLLESKVPETVPVVFTVVADPVGQGLVSSLARPGGGMTGLSDAHAELVPKRLELLRHMAPGSARVGVLLSSNPMSELQLKTAGAVAPLQGMTLVPVRVQGPQRAEIDRAFAAMLKERAVALLVIPEPTLSGNRRYIAELAIKNRLPSIATVREWAANGFLMSYGTNFHELWRRVAVYVDKILKGAKPAELPIEQPTTFDLVINLKTAKAIGITVPPELLLRADHVIE